MKKFIKPIAEIFPMLDGDVITVFSWWEYIDESSSSQSSSTISFDEPEEPDF